MEFKNKQTGHYEPVQGDNGAADVNVAGSGIIQPVDIQARYQQTIQTHNAVSVGAGTWSASAWVDVSGFNDVAITFLNDATIDSLSIIQWSNDGTTVHGEETGLVSGTAKNKAMSIPSKARYLRHTIRNADTTAAHTMSAWLFLKA